MKKEPQVNEEERHINETQTLVSKKERRTHINNIRKEIETKYKI